MGPVDDDPAVAADEPADAGGNQAAEWDDDLPVALGEEAVTDVEAVAGDASPDLDDFDDRHDRDEDDGFGYPSAEDDPIGGRRNALPRRVESWRSRSATGAIATALAMGLQQVFEPEKRRPAAVAEAPSDPYSDVDPVTVDYVPDDAESTTVHVKPWLLQKGE